MAGFCVLGVDTIPQPRYAGCRFHQADAMTFPLDGFDVIHASPPCQAYSIAERIHKNGDEKPDLIEEVRARLERKTYVIENVPGAPLLAGATMLCGTMFGLKVFRHRWFECSQLILGPTHDKHNGRTLSTNAYSCFENGATHICVAGHNFKREDGAVAMGIDWMTRKELSQAIPPAYTKWIGSQILCSLSDKPAASSESWQEIFA